MPDDAHLPHGLIAKISALQPDRWADVEAFVDALGDADTDHTMLRATQAASHAAFGKVWDNSDDALYDEL